MNEKIKKIYPVKPYFPLEDINIIKQEIEQILLSGMISNSKYVMNFERRFAEICGVKEAVAVNTGTAALEMALQCLEIENKEILVPTNTFIATVSSIIRSGAKPKLTDIDTKSLCINVESIQEKLSNKTAGIIAVHIGGLICPEIEKIKELCEDHHLFLIEDSSHAHGSNFSGKYAGAFGDVGCFSLYATKIITTSEGGIITTDNPKIADYARTLRDQGKSSSNPDEIIKLGESWRMSEIIGLIGITQLDRISEIINKRTITAKFYDREISKIDRIKPLHVPTGMIEGYYKYVAFLDKDINRDLIKKKLKEKGVFCGSEVYSIPIHLQPIYKKLFGTKINDFPYAEDICERMICLPLTTQMTENDRKYVIDSLKEVMEEV